MPAPLLCRCPELWQGTTIAHCGCMAAHLPGCSDLCKCWGPLKEVDCLLRHAEASPEVARQRLPEDSVWGVWLVPLIHGVQDCEHVGGQIKLCQDRALQHRATRECCVKAAPLNTAVLRDG